MADERKIQGICEFYGKDPVAADQAFLGRVANHDRRGFLRGAGLATLSAMIGMAIPFNRQMPLGLVPAAFANDSLLIGKDGLILLNDMPLNAETPPHLLDDEITPTARHFIRNNGLPPEEVDAASWTLDIDGFVEKPMRLTLADLRAHFEVVTKALVIECGGNGRAFFDPPASGNQWTFGAVACANWTGVRLRDILARAGVQSPAVYTAHYGQDSHLSGDPEKLPISRGVPIAKAMSENVLVAFEMNGGPLHSMNGAPLRLVVPGWPGSCSQKWLSRVQIRDRQHDGPKMTGKSYRVPNRPVAPGEKVQTEDFVVIERMPVKSLVTSHQNNAEVGSRIVAGGCAWSGDRDIAAVDVSIDFGKSWKSAKVSPPANSGAWQRWSADINFPIAGYYELWARATDSNGEIQPFAIDWNPKGYLNNTMHRVALRVL